MDITPTPPPPPIPEPMPVVNNAVPPATSPPAPKAPIVSTPIIIAIVGTALLVSGIFFGLSRIKPKEVAVAPTPTPTPIATPTPVRQPSAIAGQPAFKDFQASIATLSAVIAGFQSQDPSLTPPTLVLPLGFHQ